MHISQQLPPPSMASISSPISISPKLPIFPKYTPLFPSPLSFPTKSRHLSISLTLKKKLYYLFYFYCFSVLIFIFYFLFFIFFWCSFRKLRVFCCLALDHQQNCSANVEPSADLRVVFAGGATGGHIYPAVAIADEIKIINPNAQILFLGTAHGMESTAVPSAGYDFDSIPAVPLARPIFSPRNVLLPYRLIKSMVQCYRRLRDFDPDIVIGTGGYVSFPVCLAAALKGLKLVIQEQNSVPGIANWVLSWFADQVFVAFNSSIDYFPKHKCIVSGNPVRLSVRRYVSKAAARLHFFPSYVNSGNLEAKVVLVLGGSLGANAINIAMLNLYYQMLLELKNLFIIWQTGVEAFDEMESLVKNHPHLVLSP